MPYRRPLESSKRSNKDDANKGPAKQGPLPHPSLDWHTPDQPTSTKCIAQVGGMNFAADLRRNFDRARLFLRRAKSSLRRTVNRQARLTQSAKLFGQATRFTR
jgi:hypothetical protein